MILRQKTCDKFYSWYWNSNMTEVVTQTIWFSPFVMRYLAFPGCMMTLSKPQDGDLNQQVILFRFQYETHSLQMHPELPCRSVATLTPKLLDERYALRLVVVPCQYFPSTFPFFQPISPSSLSNIFSVAVPHLLRRHIHPCCPASPPPCLSAALFTSDLFCHTHYPGATIRPQVGSRYT